MGKPKTKTLSKADKPKLNSLSKKKITTKPIVALNEKIKKVGAKNFVKAAVDKNVNLQPKSKKSTPKIEKQPVVTQKSPVKKKEKQSETTVGAFVTAPPCLLDEDQVKRGVAAFFELAEKCQKDDKKQLFSEERPVFLQITSIKVPKVPNHLEHLDLKHGILSEDSEICLIVKDIDKDPETTVEHYEKLLADHGITSVKTILPFKQFSSEHAREFELRRRLLGLYDCFLVDGSVHGYVAHLLGKSFIAKRKMPVVVNLKATNLKEHIEKQLKKATLKINSNSDSFAVQVGFRGTSPKVIYENILSAVEGLKVKFPGGFANVRLLSILSEGSPVVPLYLTLKKKNEIKVPVIEAPRPKKYEIYTDELTTHLNKTVKVYPSGEVVEVRKKRSTKGTKLEGQQNSSDVDSDNDDLEDEDSDNDLVKEEDEDNENEEPLMAKIERESDAAIEQQRSKRKKQNKKKGNIKKKQENENEPDEDELEKIRQSYLQEYEKEVRDEEENTSKNDAATAKQKNKKSKKQKDEKKVKKEQEIDEESNLQERLTKEAPVSNSKENKKNKRGKKRKNNAKVNEKEINASANNVDSQPRNKKAKKQKVSNQNKQKH